VCLDDQQEVFIGGSYGQSQSYSSDTAAIIDAEVKALCEGCYQQAVDLLTANRDKLDLLVEALLTHETLSRKEFVQLMDEGVMPEITSSEKPRSVREILEQEQANAPQQETPAATEENHEQA
jgi:cell division protease FtsH